MYFLLLGRKKKKKKKEGKIIILKTPLKLDYWVGGRGGEKQKKGLKNHFFFLGTPPFSFSSITKDFL